MNTKCEQQKDKMRFIVLWNEVLGMCQWDEVVRQYRAQFGWWDSENGWWKCIKKCTVKHGFNVTVGSI